MILFPSHPSFRKQPDPSFEAEMEAAKAAGFKIGLVDVDQEIFVHSLIPCLYRGWIVKPTWYYDLYAQESEMIVTPIEYENSYHFPSWYDQLSFHSITPRSVWVRGSRADFILNDVLNPDAFAFQLILDRISQLSAGPLIIKDWVKSRKHEWFDSCFIPDSNDIGNLRRVITNFLNGQGDDLAGGLVFREFVKLKPIGTHPKSKIPLINEHRFFVFKGQIFYSAPYWDSGFYGTVKWPDKKVIIDLIADIKSNFFAIDVAEKEDGEWIVIEVNDGGTAGIPEGGNAANFYKALRELF